MEIKTGNPLTAPVTPSNRKTPIDRNQVDPDIRQAAEGMEAMFIDYMMQVMRKTVPKSDMDLENAGSQIYRGMLDSELAQKAAHQGGIGLADTLIAYLQGQRYTQQKGQGPSPNAPPSVSTGGTHAGQPNRK